MKLKHFTILLLLLLPLTLLTGVSAEVNKKPNVVFILVDEMPELKNELLAKLKKWWIEVDARFPEGYTNNK